MSILCSNNRSGKALLLAPMYEHYLKSAKCIETQKFGDHNWLKNTCAKLTEEGMTFDQMDDNEKKNIQKFINRSILVFTQNAAVFKHIMDYKCYDTTERTNDMFNTIKSEETDIMTVAEMDDFVLIKKLNDDKETNLKNAIVAARFNTLRDGSAILYNDNKLELLNVGLANIDKPINENEKPIKMFMDDESNVKRNKIYGESNEDFSEEKCIDFYGNKEGTRIMACAIFRIKGTQKEFMVATTHLEENPIGYENEAKRVKSAGWIEMALKLHYNKFYDATVTSTDKFHIPIILTGDFNMMKYERWEDLFGEKGGYPKKKQ
jgi:hypothetical protein